MEVLGLRKWMLKNVAFLLRRYRFTNDQSDFINYKVTRNQFKAVCRRKKYLFQLNKRKSLSQACNDPRSFWSILKGSFDISRQPLTNPIPVREWIKYFTTLLFDSQVHTALTVEDNTLYFNEEMDTVLNSDITLDEVQKSILKLKLNKAHGTDGIPAEFYKSTLNLISPILVLLFNKIFESAEFPSSWLETILVPVHKSGTKCDPSNYRGISLLNVLYKIFSVITNNRLVKRTDQFEIIDEMQSGFRSGYSAIDNIFCLQSMIQKYLCQTGSRFYVLYIDFKKAFDSLHHSKVFACLNKKGVQGKMFQTLLSMYSNLNTRIKIHGKLSPPISCNVGLKQGDPTSTTIFNIYINELYTDLKEKCKRGIFITNNIPDVLCIMFADDVANCADTVVSLQNQLDVIDVFCSKTGMQVNLEKSEIIVFRNRGPLRKSEKWFFRGKYVRLLQFTNIWDYYLHQNCHGTPQKEN